MIHWYAFPIIGVAMALGVYLRTKRIPATKEHQAGIETLFDGEK
jgi:hypothetical protein